MRRVGLLVLLDIKLVVEIYEIVVKIVVEIVVIELVIIELVIIELVIIELVVDLVVFLIVQLVLEIFFVGGVVRYLLRQPRSRPPFPISLMVKEAPFGLQHGGHYRDLLVV